MKLVNASISETGRAGWDGTAKAGDQTGREVCVRSWYSRPWDVALRYPDDIVRAKATDVAVKLAESGLVGYDQSERNTLYFALKGCGWNVDKYIASGERTETDCSAYVYAVYSCLIPKMRSDNNAPVTSTMREQFRKWGFEIPNANLVSGDGLVTGDIVLKEGTHAALVIGDDSVSPGYADDIENAITVLARDVIAGKWGNGCERMEKLYSAIQTRVNEILREG